MSPYQPSSELTELVVLYLKTRVANDPEWAALNPALRMDPNGSHTPDDLYAATARAIIIAEHNKAGLQGVQVLQAEMTTWLHRQTNDA